MTEQLKMQDQMKWVGLMNNINICAEEIVLQGLCICGVKRAVERLPFTNMKIKIAEKA